MATETNQSPAPVVLLPKARFMESSDNVTKHKRLNEDPVLQRGFDYSLMQYAAILVKGQPTTNDAAMNALKLQGAHEFIEVFKQLAEQPLPLPSRLVTPANLNHRV